MKAPERERQFAHDSNIEKMREERRTAAVLMSRLRTEEELKLKAQRLTTKNEEIRKQNEHKRATEIMDRQHEENEKQRIAEAARLQLEAQER